MPELWRRIGTQTGAPIQGSFMRFTATTGLIVLLAACQSVFPLGEWQCSNSERDYELFSMSVKQSIEYRTDATYVERLAITYNFDDLGDLFVTYVMPGVWSLDGDLLKETSGQGEVVHLESDVEVQAEDVRAIFAQLFPDGESLRFEIVERTDSSMLLKDLDDPDREALRCDRT
ncbi:MAG: hypothetical protein QNJ14_10625 [Woeseiaceae bacterium]|nr:hypothetical protein [Woeseiaceae bacterium]